MEKSEEQDNAEAQDQDKGRRGIGLPDLESIKSGLAEALAAKKKNRVVKGVFMLTGATVAAAGMAADITFLGGVGTLTILTCAYSDMRNAQHIRKISAELSKIDEKIDGLRKTQQPLPDYAPALRAVRGGIDDFQRSAEKLPPEVAENLEALKLQVEALENKIGPVESHPKP